MKKIFLCLFLFSHIFLSSIFASNFKPFTKLYTIETEKFDIIYSEKSRRTAYQLAEVADDLYKKYSEIMGIEISYRIPVSITADVGVFNAYANFATYPHLVLFDTPSSDDFSRQSEEIEATFVHELCHLFFLAPNNTTLSKIFGSWASFTLLNTPYFMTEGISVAMDSYDGFGRVNDPIVAQRIRQDVREGKFKTPIQATDAYDLYPYLTVAYEYGALFNQYIINKYGIEKYREYLNKMQNTYTASFRYYKSGTYGAFKKVYGIDFLEEWAEFQYAYITPDVIVNTNKPITENDTTINTMTQNNGKLYYVNNSYSTLIEYNPKLGKNKTIKTINKGASSIDLNKDGTKVLIGSDTVYTTFSTHIIQEYDIEKKRYTKLKIKNIEAARYFRDGIVAIGANLNNTFLAFYDTNGEMSEMLIPPSKNAHHSYPTVIDDNRVAFIYAQNGVKQLAIYDYSSKTVSIVKSSSKDDENIWKHMNGLSYSDNKLLFSYNDDDRFYKLAIFDLSTNKLMLTKVDYSGSVLIPVLVDENIYYKARFSETEAVMLYPNSIENLNADVYTANLANTKSVDSIINVVEEYEEQYAAGMFNYKEKSYFGIKYANPFKYWLPIPIYAEGSPYYITGAGIMTAISDPIDNNFIIFTGGLDIVSMFLDFDLMWSNQSFLYPLSIGISDKVIYSSDIRYRATTFSLAYSPYIYLNNRSILQFTPFVAAALLFLTDDISIYTSPTESYLLFDYGNTAYSWPYNSYVINVGANIYYKYQNSLFDSINADSVSLLVAPIYSINKEVYRVDAKLDMQSRYLPLKLSIFGGYSSSENGISFSTSDPVFGTRNIGGGNEFISFVNDNNLSSNWLLGYELDLIGRILIENNLGYFYFNNIYASLGYRASYFDEHYLNAATLKLGVETKIMFASVGIPISIEGVIALQLPPNQMDTSSFFAIDNWYFGFNFSSALL